MNKQEFSDTIVTSITPDIETLATLHVAVWSGESMLLNFVLPEDEKTHDDVIQALTDRFKTMLDEGKAGKFSLVYQKMQKSETEFMLLFKVTPKP